MASRSRCARRLHRRGSCREQPEEQDKVISEAKVLCFDYFSSCSSSLEAGCCYFTVLINSNWTNLMKL